MLLAASLIALVIHSYYVQYYVSSHEYAFLSLKPLPPFPDDKMHWIKAEKKKSIENNAWPLAVKYRRAAVISAMEMDYKRIYSTPLYLAILPSNNILGNSLPRAKEKAFWLGCILPLVIVLIPLLLLVRNYLQRKQAMLSANEFSQSVFTDNPNEQIPTYEKEKQPERDSPSKHARTALDEVQEIGKVLIVQGYRRFSAEHGNAPSEATSDEEIVRIYVKVGSAFRSAAEKRGEHISAGILNRIILYFLQVRELSGDEMMDQHLQYEIQKYVSEGLRQDYKKEFILF